MRVAIVGAGFIAGFHADALRAVPGVEIVAVVEPDPERAAAFAAAHRIATQLRSIDQLAGLGAQVAHVLTPPHLHEQQIAECIELDLHVFTEKPAALSTARIEQLAALAAARGVQVGVNHNFLHASSVEPALDAAAAGRVGRVQHASVVWSIALRELESGNTGAWMFREPPNIVFEAAVHPFSVVEALIGPPDEVTVASTRTRTLPDGRPFLDRWHVAGRAGEASVDVVMSLSEMHPLRTVTVIGTDGVIHADVDAGVYELDRPSAHHALLDPVMQRLGDATAAAASAGAELTSAVRRTVRPGPAQGTFETSINRSVAAFYDALAAGEAPRTSLTVAGRVQQWCEPLAAFARNVALPAPSRSSSGTRRPEGGVAVVGANGFIGRHLVASLGRAGVPAVAVLRRPVAPEVMGWTDMDAPVVQEIASLDDPDSLRRAFDGVDAVVHLATGSAASLEDVEQTMVGGTLTVVDAARSAGAVRIVYASSIAAFYLGADAGVDVVDDDSPLDPEPEGRGLYARGKIMTEQRLRGSGHPIVIVRPGIVLGSGTPPQHAGLGSWRGGVHCLGWGTGDNPLPIVMVQDVADGIALLATAPDVAPGSPFNLATECGLTAQETVDLLAEATGRPFEFVSRSTAAISAGMQATRTFKRLLGRREPKPLLRDVRAMQHIVAVRSSGAHRLGWRPKETRDEVAAALRRDYGAS